MKQQTMGDDKPVWEGTNVQRARPKPSTKARIISLSTLYVTVELLEPTNLQPGQTVSISHE